MTTPSAPPPEAYTELLAGPLDGQSLAHVDGSRIWILVDPRSAQHIIAVGERALGRGLADLYREYQGLLTLLQLQGVYRPVPGEPRAAAYLDLAGPGDSPRARRYRLLAHFTHEWYQLTVVRAKECVDRQFDIGRLVTSWPEDLVVSAMVSEYLAHTRRIDE